MTPNAILAAKITRLTLSGAVHRQRLFELLDAGGNRPVTWISAPAGSGKSTLVASYLDARNLPNIWYKCDEGDTDPATFFYYMGLAAQKAAPRHHASLPLLTPEYLAGIPAFTRRFFEQLYRRIMAPQAQRAFTIVLDNYQDLPAESPFHEMIAAGLDAIPQGVRIVVTSRSAPPGQSGTPAGQRQNQPAGLRRYPFHPGRGTGIGPWAHAGTGAGADRRHV